jgi:hypothetical protein
MFTISSQTSSAPAGVDDNGWFDTSALPEDASFTISGTWIGSIALDVSNEEYEQGVARSQYRTAATYTSNTGPNEIPRNIGRFIRFRRSAWTSGTAYIGVHPPSLRPEGATYGQ